MKKIILVISLFLSIGIILLHNCISVNAQSIENTEIYKLDNFEFIPISERENYLQSTNNIDGYLLMWNTYIPVRFTNAYTPNNTPVSVYEILGEIDSNMIVQGNEYYDDQFPNANRKSSATAYYNCHSFAWYMNSNTNTYWMNYPTNYYIDEDNSYVEVINPQEGDIICYFDDNETPNNMDDDENLHSGIVYEILSGTSNGICGNANLVMVESKWGPAGLYEHRGDECPYTSYSDGDADYVKYYRPNTNNKYTLSNYSGAITTDRIINGNSTIKSDKCGMYELNVTYAKNYEFNITSTNELEIRIYDEHMQRVEVDINTSGSNAHIIKYLTVGIYYLRVSYVDSINSGTITTIITSRNTLYLSYNKENDILINYYNNINTYNYINNKGAGFYKFTLTATKADGTSVIYPSDAMIIKDANDESTINKYDVLGYSELAESNNGINSMYVYLPRNGYFYIHVTMPSVSYVSMNINITPVEYQDIDLYEEGIVDNFTVNIFETNINRDYAEGFVINQTSKYTLTFSSVDNLSDNVTVVLFKKEYDSTTGTYYIDNEYAEYLNNSNKTRTETVVLDPGTYYIGYFNNLDGIAISASLSRIITDYGNILTAMIPDPDMYTLHGSEVSLNGGSFRGSTITEGFTRCIFFEGVNVPSFSRLDYDWYSSNDSVATVSSYGTVLALSVNVDTQVTIIAVYKADPSIIFLKTFTIKEETKTDIIEVKENVTHSLTSGNYQIDLINTNCPYPWFQYYTWSVFVPCQENDIIVNIGPWGEVTSSGSGFATITGHYILNPRVYVIINITFEN